MFIVTKEIDSENISKLCRTCLREDGEKMICLFVGPAGSSLAAKLRSLSCLEVWQGDGLPEKMCDRCVTRAESALLYREQCRAADRALRQAALKVSGLTSYTTVSGCKLYQQNQGFVPIQNPQKTLKCIECGAVFVNYEELYAHSRLHLPSIQNATPVQHMHIVEPQSTYFNLSNLNNSLANDSVLMHAMRVDNEGPSRAACALHCSLCNHTFTNRTQLISHNFTHGNDNVDLSSADNENIEVSEDSNQIAQNLSYDRSIDHSAENSIQNLSFPRPAIETPNEIQNLSYPNNIDLENTDQIQNVAMLCGSLECGNGPLAQDLAFSKITGQSVDANQSKLELHSKGSLISKFKKHVCSVCTKSFAQKSKLLSHQLSHTGQRPFQCPNCDKAYSSKSKLNAHVRLHSNTNVHECLVCGKTFAYASYLEDHFKTHRSQSEKLSSKNEKNYKCTVCDKQFRFVKNLRSHLKLHAGGNDFRCEFCDKRFGQKYNLKMHLLTHKKIKSHKCDLCGKCFTQKGNLVEHFRIHTRLKPFKCDLCSKSFSQSSHLKSHKISHDTERQHQCRLCGKRFKLGSHLKRHLDSHGGKKSFKCMECNQLFSQAFSLKRHLKRHAEIHT